MNHQGCPSRSELADFDLGRLPTERREEIDRHLDECESCSNVLMSLEELTDVLVKQLRKPLPAELVPDDSEIALLIGRVVDARTALPNSDNSSGPATVDVGQSSSSGTRFRVLRSHAKGGLGEVFVAQDMELNREVALKQIQDRFADDADRRARFSQEAEITACLEHPSIVPVYGMGKYGNGRPFYAMRMVRGESLKDAIREFHASPDHNFDSIAFRKLLGRFMDVCDAIQYAHSRGVIHRDLKPGNIMMGKFGETLVVDWGLAKATGREDHVAESDEGMLSPESGSGSTPTAMGATFGSPGYLSPEQAAGRIEDLGTASDVYSLGATLYCILTGRAPFESKNRVELLENTEKGNFKRPRQVGGAIPKAVEAICLKAMSLNPHDRYESPATLRDDIEAWLADQPVVAHRDTLVDRSRRFVRRHKGVTVATAAGLVLVTIVSLFAGVLVDAARRKEVRERQAKEEANVTLNEKIAELERANTDFDEVIAVHFNPNLNAAEHMVEKDEVLDRACARRPTYIELWRYLAWSRFSTLSALGGNDKEMYVWKKRGIMALLDGLNHNPESAQLTYDIGFYLARLGRTGFRAKFATDESLHESLGQHVQITRGCGLEGNPDSLLVARLFYKKASGLLDCTQETRLVRSRFVTTPVVIHTNPTTCLFEYAIALQREHRFEDSIKFWKEARDEWSQFANQFEEKELQIINHEYWDGRCRWELDEVTLDARRSLSDACSAVNQNDDSPDLLSMTFEKFAAALTDDDKFLDFATQDELTRLVERYLTMTGLDEIPDDFPLREFVELPVRENSLGFQMPPRVEWQSTTPQNSQPWSPKSAIDIEWLARNVIDQYRFADGPPDFHLPEVFRTDDVRRAMEELWQFKVSAKIARDDDGAYSLVEVGWADQAVIVDDGTIDEKVIRLLEKLPNVHVLFECRTNLYGRNAITDAGIQQLTLLNNVTGLEFIGEPITDQSLPRLFTMKQLRELSLFGTQVSDASVMLLKELDHLERLDLRKTNVTAGAVEELRKSLPECEIRFDGGHEDKRLDSSWWLDSPGSPTWRAGDSTQRNGPLGDGRVDGINDHIDLETWKGLTTKQTPPVKDAGSEDEASKQ